WGDYDNDGDLDLYLANYGSANRLLRNDGASVFTALTSGPLGDAGNSTGVAWGDYDGDGDLDLYLANDGSSNVLMRNDLANGNHWLHLDLVGLVSNRSAIGTRVRVVAGGLHQIQEVSGGSGYLSQNSLTLEFGLGAAAVADSVEISWPSGYVETYVAVPADQRLTVTELSVVAVGESPAPGPPLALAAPFPNPTDGPTTFRLALPRATHVRLSLYDVQGRRVATPVRGSRGPGWHSFTWNGKDSRGRQVAAGIYFARLETLGEIRTRRIIVLH
ncbi:MAG: ASPIC/UnbV domain-containing protein, partial [Candidatus Eisenbacteria bacterium]